MLYPKYLNIIVRVSGFRNFKDPKQQTRKEKITLRFTVLKQGLETTARVDQQRKCLVTLLQPDNNHRQFIINVVIFLFAIKCCGRSGAAFYILSGMILSTMIFFHAYNYLSTSYQGMWHWLMPHSLIILVILLNSFHIATYTC